MKSKNTIEFNGQHYDAVSGTPLPASKPVAQPTIDGVYRSNQTVASLVKPLPLSDVVSRPIVAVPKQSALQRQAADHARPHQPQSASTLMRRSVKKPAESLKAQTTVQGSLQHASPQLLTAKQSVYSLDQNRVTRAKQSEQSPLISRHYNQSTADQQGNVPMIVAPLAVQPVPVKPEAKEPSIVPQPTSKPHDMFEQAIANAGNYVDVKAHHAKFKKHRRNHLASLTAGGFALLAIATFAAYQNSPSLQYKIASLNSGISAPMPNFKAAGFTYDGAKGSDGTLTVGFTGKNASYQLVQKQTNLSSDDMINNIGSVDASGSSNYNTVQAGGTTVYRFSNNEATWVSDGNWYSVSGTQALTDSQVTSLVNNI